MSKATELLEQLQRQTRGMSSVHVTTLAEAEKKKRNRDLERRVLTSIGITDESKIADANKQFRKSFRKVRKTIPTPLEDFNSHVIMKHLADQLEKAARQLKIDLPAMPVYGSLPVGQLNARAIRVPESKEHLIAFQHGVFGFANLLTKAVAASFRVKARWAGGELSVFSWRLRDFKWSWARNDEPLRRLGEFLQAYLVFGDAHMAEPYLLRDPFNLPAFVMCESFELFLFGHELGHVIAGHLDDAAETRQMMGTTEVPTLSPSWKMEFEADAIGMTLAMQAMLNHRCDITNSYYGIDMTFSTMEIVELATSILTDGEAKLAPESKSHPRHALRRDFLRQMLRRQLGSRKARKPIRMAETMEEVLHQMWRRIEPRFKELHEAGERPSPIWSPRIHMPQG